MIGSERLQYVFTKAVKFAWSRRGSPPPPHYTRFCLKRPHPYHFCKYLQRPYYTLQKRKKNNDFQLLSRPSFFVFTVFLYNICICLKKRFKHFNRSFQPFDKSHEKNEITFIAIEKSFIFFFYNISVQCILSPPDCLIWKLNKILIYIIIAGQAGDASTRTHAPPPPHPAS